jgi:ABC-type Fe3+ transport system substrate-binding protein
MKRREFLGATGAGLAIAAWPRLAGAQSLEALAAAAEKEGPVVWYESSPADQAAKIVAAFAKRWPKVKVEHVRIVGGNEFPARIMRESQANSPTADVGSGGADHVWALAERNLLAKLDWSTIGIPKALAATDFAVVSAASVYVLLWNTTKVKDDEAPKSWDDLVDPKWRGRVGTWVRSAGIAHLPKVWGAARTDAWVAKLVAQKPFLFKSTFPLAQQVAAGEVDVAIGIYHTAQPPIKKGAPIKVRALDPTPISSIFSSITAKARNPNGAKLLMAWLHSAEGAAAYEEATDRGNHLIPATATAKLLAGRTVAEFPADETATYSAFAKKYDEMLAKAGEAR